MSKGSGERVTAIILIPKFYNPDERGQRDEVEEVKLTVTCTEITRMMIGRWGEGGCTLDPEPKKGFWGREGIIYEDDIVALEIDDLPDTEEDKRWVIEYCGEILCRRFRQEAILVKFCRVVEVCVVTAFGGGDN